MPLPGRRSCPDLIQAPAPRHGAASASSLVAHKQRLVTAQLRTRSSAAAAASVGRSRRKADALESGAVALVRRVVGQAHELEHVALVLQLAVVAPAGRPLGIAVPIERRPLLRNHPGLIAAPCDQPVDVAEDFNSAAM